MLPLAQAKAAAPAPPMKCMKAAPVAAPAPALKGMKAKKKASQHFHFGLLIFFNVGIQCFSLRVGIQLGYSMLFS